MSVLGSTFSIWPKAKNASRRSGKLARCWRFGIALCLATFWHLDIAQSQTLDRKNHYRQWAFIQLNNINEFYCLDELYHHESRWNPKAKNGSHYGIPQGKSKYLLKANGYKQVEWGIKYNVNRYGSMCKALDHWRLKGWH